MEPTEEPRPNPPTAEPTAAADGRRPSRPRGARGAATRPWTDAQEAIEDGQAALADGDFAAYGAAQDRLAEALDAGDRRRGCSWAAEPGIDAEVGADPVRARWPSRSRSALRCR